MTEAGTGLRPIDLARVAGVSTQQIRNYADAGILPPAPRSPAGYRRFDHRHREALVTYRTLAKGFGWDTARAIMQAINAEDVATALTEVDAAHAALHEQRVSLLATETALEAVAGQDHSGLSRSDLRVGDVAKELGVRTSALRLWESAGLLLPRRDRGTGYRSFSPTDVRDARMIIMLRRGHYGLAQIRPILDGLRESGSSDALRAAVGQRQAALTQRATLMLEGSAVLHGYLREGADQG
jgi:DNA-binding transcriptional MerR regulator